MNIQEAFSFLRARLGSDRKCARFVGMTPQHFEALRNGRANIPRRTADYICLKASGLAAASSASEAPRV